LPSIGGSPDTTARVAVIRATVSARRASSDPPAVESRAQAERLERQVASDGVGEPVTQILVHDAIEPPSPRLLISQDIRRRCELDHAHSQPVAGEDFDRQLGYWQEIHNRLEGKSAWSRCGHVRFRIRACCGMCV